MYLICKWNMLQQKKKLKIEVNFYREKTQIILTFTFVKDTYFSG